MILKLRIGCVVNAARHDGVSAQEACLFDHNDGSAFIGRADRRRQTCAAATNDDHIRSHGNILRRFFFNRLAECPLRVARLLEAILHGCNQRAARNCRAGNGIHLCGLIGDDRSGNVFKNGVRHAGGFHLIDDIHVRDRVLSHSHFHRHGSVHGVHRRGIRAGSQRLCISAVSAHCQTQRQQNGPDFLHIILPFVGRVSAQSRRAVGFILRVICFYFIMYLIFIQHSFSIFRFLNPYKKIARF